MALPYPSEFIEHGALAAVETGVAEACVDLVLAVFSVEARGAAALVLLEARQLARPTVTARIRVADVALGEDRVVAPVFYSVIIIVK